MDYTVPQFVTYIAAWLGLIGGIWALFDRSETVIHPELREKLSDWLTSKTPIRVADWPGMFASVFDRVFGEKHFAWRCFSCSANASLLTVFIVFQILSAVYGYDWMEEFPGWGVYTLFLFGQAFLCVFINILPDYISLLETRLILKYMSAVNILLHPLFLIIDLVLTSLISCVYMSVLCVAMNVCSGESIFQTSIYMNPINFIYWAFDFQTDSPMPPHLRALVYSTYFTSIWIWLFVLSGLAVRLLTAIGLSARKIGSFFNVEEKPLRSMGFVSMVLMTIVFIIIPIIR